MTRAPVTRRKPAAPRPRIAVLVKRTSYRTFVEDGHDARTIGLLADGDPTVGRMRRSHEAHLETVRELRAAIASLGVEARFYEGPRTRIDPGFQLVVTVGGDGTVLAASHQIGADCPLLGVNSAPASSVGFFCAATKGNVRSTLAKALRGTLPGVTLTRMRVELNGRVLHNRVLNEALFCQASPAATSRYILRIAKGGPDDGIDEEEQTSSGLWIGPAAGSTAAQRSAGGRVLPLTSRKLQLVVREPYIGADRWTRLRKALVAEDGHIELLSKMRHAKLFLDGHHDEYAVEIGDRLRLRRSDETLTILGLARTLAPESAARKQKEKKKGQRGASGR